MMNDPLRQRPDSYFMPQETPYLRLVAQQPQVRQDAMPMQAQQQPIQQTGYNQFNAPRMRLSDLISQYRAGL